MIHSFSMRNFFSFADEAVLSFGVGDRTPDSTLFFDAPSGQRLSKVLAVVGPNASGKTNLLKGLPFLAWFATQSFRALEADEHIPYNWFRFTDAPEPTADFRLVIEVDGEVLRYELTLTSQRVEREHLYRKHGNRFRYLFKRDAVPDSPGIQVVQQDYGFEPDTVQQLLRANASLLSVLRQIKHGESRPLIGFFESLQTNVDYHGREAPEPRDRLSRLIAATDFFETNETLKSRADQLLCASDLGILRTDLKKQTHRDEKGTEHSFTMPYVVHKVHGREYNLPLMLESSGTQNLYALAWRILPVLEHGGLAVMDEIEVDLHPHVIPAILELFFDPVSNPHSAQLLFSTHSTDVLRVLDKTQIALVEKDEDCRSSTWRLDSVKGVRRQDNLYAKYMSGSYGAVPDL